jgi:FHS family L-fucose permease-like MFS transporter
MQPPRSLIVTIVALFFIWGGLTSLNDVLIPKLKGLFALSYTEAMLTQFAFFTAYFIVSLPAGVLIARVGYVKGIVIGLVTMALGCLLFMPASTLGVYAMFLGALFVLAAGITILQVAANPLIAQLAALRPRTAD